MRALRLAAVGCAPPAVPPPPSGTISAPAQAPCLSPPLLPAPQIINHMKLRHPHIVELQEASAWQLRGWGRGLQRKQALEGPTVAWAAHHGLPAACAARALPCYEAVVAFSTPTKGTCSPPHHCCPHCRCSLHTRTWWARARALCHNSPARPRVEGACGSSPAGPSGFGQAGHGRTPKHQPTSPNPTHPLPARNPTPPHRRCWCWSMRRGVTWRSTSRGTAACLRTWHAGFSSSW